MLATKYGRIQSDQPRCCATSMLPHATYKMQWLLPIRQAATRLAACAYEAVMRARSSRARSVARIILFETMLVKGVEIDAKRGERAMAGRQRLALLVLEPRAAR